MGNDYLKYDATCDTIFYDWANDALFAALWDNDDFYAALMGEIGRLKDEVFTEDNIRACIDEAGIPDSEGAEIISFFENRGDALLSGTMAPRSEGGNND